MSESESLIRLALSILWLSIGFLIGRRQGRVGTSLLWTVLWGPLGVLVLLFGSYGRSRLGSEPPPRSAEPVGIGSMVNVEVDGSARLGTIENWRRAGDETETLVRYTTGDGVVTSAWFLPHRVRLP